MKRNIYLIITLMLLLPVSSMGQLKGTSRNRLISWTQSEDGILTFDGRGILDGREFPGFSDDFKGYNSSIIISFGITEVRFLNGMYQAESISLPNSLKKIGAHAFDGCQMLKSLTIPASVTEIDPSAFDMKECGGGDLEKIIVDNNNTIYKSIDGILYDKDVKTLICCPSGYSGDVNIPSTVESIEERAFFYCHNLKNVKLPENLKAIKKEAFVGSNIRFINIPKDVFFIGIDAFRDCEELEKAYMERKGLNVSNVFSENVTISDVPIE